MIERFNFYDDCGVLAGAAAALTLLAWLFRRAHLHFCLHFALAVHRDFVALAHTK